MAILWIQDNTRHYFTPGGDPVWICGNCGEGKHVYGIENVNEPKCKCPDCGCEIKYPWQIKKRD